MQQHHILNCEMMFDNIPRNCPFLTDKTPLSRHRLDAVIKGNTVTD